MTMIDFSLGYLAEPENYIGLAVFQVAACLLSLAIAKWTTLTSAVRISTFAVVVVTALYPIFLALFAPEFAFGSWFGWLLDPTFWYRSIVDALLIWPLSYLTARMAVKPAVNVQTA